MSYKVNFINKITIIVIVIWSVLMLGAALLRVINNYSYAKSLAKNEAMVSVKKDLAYRSWVASHGGVYVPITKRTPPNPYLSHIKNRDVYTSSGQHLTLMNPAYTLSQMMQDYSDLYGVKGHITSRVLMNPKNAPDAWEEKALEKAERTGESTSSVEYIDGEEYLRYLNPLVTQESCLKCHAFQGYKVGDIRGGVSVSIPLKKFKVEAFNNSLLDVLITIIIYTFGLVVIFYGRRKLKDMLENKIKDYEQHIFSLVNMIEKRDSYTAGHTQRVARYSCLIAKEMGFSEEKIDELNRACMLHDIGKISTPDSILLKPGKLTKLEYEIIKEHVVVSYELLNEVDIYKDIAEIIRHHHERYDGSGYPQGLKGNQIPIMSQIMSVADAFDAMTTNRIYKARKSVDTALAELQSLSEKEFNAQIVNAAALALKDIDVELSIDQKPRTKIEKERFSYFYRDQVTGVYNRDYLEFILAYNHTSEFNIKYINFISLHNFNQYNQKNGWSAGDKLLKKFAQKLESLGYCEYIFRIYGDDFLILNSNYYNIEEDSTVLEEVLYETGVTLSFKHINLKKESVNSLEDLEKLL